MRLLVSGAGGFLGRALTAALLAPEPPLAFERLTLTDLRLSVDHADPRLRVIEGDLRDPAHRAALVGDGVDVLLHLAALPSGTTEGQPAEARAVNLDASIDLFEAVAAAGARPRIVHASSIAALGQPGTEQVTDATPLRPTMTYGALKAMLESWLCDMHRRGSISGLAIRLPGLVARPLTRTGQRSAFLSDAFHYMRAGQACTLPVRPEATSWLMSVDRCVANMVHAVQLDAQPEWPAFTLPALRLGMSEVVAALAEATGADPSLVSYDPDPALEAIFASYPPLRTAIADTLGFRHDGSVDELVRAALAGIERGV